MSTLGNAGFWREIEVCRGIFCPLRWRKIISNGWNTQFLLNAYKSTGGIVINTQDTNYSTGGVVITTQDTNYSTGGVVIITQDTNYSTGGMVINTQDTNYSTGEMVI